MYVKHPAPCQVPNKGPPLRFICNDQLGAIQCLWFRGLLLAILLLPGFACLVSGCRIMIRIGKNVLFQYKNGNLELLYLRHICPFIYAFIKTCIDLLLSTWYACSVPRWLNPGDVGAL